MIAGRKGKTIEFTISFDPGSYTHLDVYKRQEIDIVGSFDFFRVNLENCLASGKVGKLDWHAPVKSAGARERRVQSCLLYTSRCV